MTQVYSEKQITIEAFEDLGRMGNNCYVLRSPEGEGVTIVDVPEGIEAVIEALGDEPIERIVVTHSHFDHWLGFDTLRAHTDAPVFAGAQETNLEASRDIQPLQDGAIFEVGSAQVQVIHTPGHTPGSICLLAHKALLTGDTLFPGGPGRTRTPEDLQTLIRSITTRLYVLEPQTILLPGHGATTLLADSQREYDVFAGKEHPADLAGDVLWLES